MPKKWTDAAEKRAYYRDWWASEKGHALRKSVLLRKSMKERRFPSKASIAKYNISTEELLPILESLKSNQI